MWLLDKIRKYEQDKILKKQEEMERQKKEEELVEHLLDLNFNFDVNELLEFRDRCVLLGIEESIDDFIYIDKLGSIISVFPSYVAGAILKKLEVLNISEGIEVLISRPFKFNCSIPIIFPSTLKGLSTLCTREEEDGNNKDTFLFTYDDSIINFDFSSQSVKPFFNILDFSKCNSITNIGYRGFSNICVNKLILPSSITHIDTNAFEDSEIKELVLNSKISFNSHSFKGAKIENLVFPGIKALEVDALDGADGVKAFNEIFIDRDMRIEPRSMNYNVENIYLPLLKENFMFGLNNYIKYIENKLGKSYKTFSDKEWSSVLNVFGRFLSLDRSNLISTQFKLQGLNIEIPREDIEDLIDVNGLLFGICSFFYLEPELDNLEDKDNIVLLLNYMSNYWNTFVYSTELDKYNFNIFIYNENICDKPNYSLIRDLDYTFILKKSIASKGTFSLYLDKSLVSELKKGKAE